MSKILEFVERNGLTLESFETRSYSGTQVIELSCFKAREEADRGIGPKHVELAIKRLEAAFGCAVFRDAELGYPLDIRMISEALPKVIADRFTISFVLRSSEL